MGTRIDASGILLFSQIDSSSWSAEYNSTTTPINSGYFPITFNNTDTLNTTLEVQFITDLSFNSADQYFIMGSDNITIEGSNNVVNVNVDSYPGLVQNGTGSNAYSDITIQNIGVESTNTLSNNGGWIGQRYFGNGGTNNNAINCYSTGDIGSYAGGIFGNNSAGSATNCYSIGEIGYQAGGIFGSVSLAGASATNCYSTGDIDQFAGGIFGSESSSQAIATNCYSTGTIGNSAGGIFGNYSSSSATNCYSIGDIGFAAGGIFGRDSQGSATNCYSTGPINSDYAGGIFGRYSQSQALAINCYSIGTIGGQYAGGIFGANSLAGASATNCYCTGGTNIGDQDPSYCYAIDGSANWLDSAADAAFGPYLSDWTDIDTNSTNVPYRLTSFLNQQILYDPSGGTNVNPEVPDILNPTDYTWSITSVNGSTSGQTGIIIDAFNGDISFTSLSDTTYAVNVLAEDSFGNYSFETFTNIISNICFPAGTPIVTNQGIIAIHKINPAIHTIRNKKIVAITKTVSPDKYLVRFEKDALGANLPCEATTMTQNHMLFYKGKMMKAKEFVNNESVSKVPYKGTVLYNVLMEEHDKMVVNNLICETLHPENYVAKMHHAFKVLTPKQRVELIQKVNKEIIKRDIFSTFKKSGAKMETK